MGRTSGGVVAAATAALAIGTFSAPVAAADPRLAFVNGIPGRTVEVCVGGDEVVSRLRYGRARQALVDAGTSTIRFRVAGPGECDGRLLARKTVELSDDDDVTLVGTARAPQKVVEFDNLLAPAPIGPIAWRAIRHAADVGPVVFTEEELDYETPSAVPAVWEKGDQEIETGQDTSLVSAARPTAVAPFEGPQQFNLHDGRRTEIILVGTTLRNARFAVVDRATLPL